MPFLLPVAAEPGFDIVNTAGLTICEINASKEVIIDVFVSDTICCCRGVGLSGFHIQPSGLRLKPGLALPSRRSEIN